MPHAKLLLIALIVLCSGAGGCGQVQTFAPTLEGPILCPPPPKPELPQLDDTLPIEHLANIKPLLLRDDVLRQHIQGLNDTINCYKGQVSANVTTN